MKVGSALSAVMSEEAEKKEPLRLLRRRRRTTCWTLFHFTTQPALAAVVCGTNLEFEAQTKQQMVEVSFNYKKCTAIPTHTLFTFHQGEEKHTGTGTLFFGYHYKDHKREDAKMQQHNNQSPFRGDPR